MRVVWSHKVKVMITKASFKIIKNIAQCCKIQVQTNSNEPTKRVLCLSLKNNHHEQRNIDSKMIILKQVIQELFQDSPGLRTEVPNFLE